MNHITGIDHIGVRVRDLSRARAFYERLGFTFLIGPIGPEPVAVMEHPCGVNINFILNASPSAGFENMLMDKPEKYAGYTHIALRVNDIEATQAFLSDQGITITEGPIVFPTGASLFIRDQDNNVLEFHESLHS
ncbi:MAG: VOC family protein [Ottowia sp.]|nr:VOC family protein [Ottowia sp.]